MKSKEKEKEIHEKNKQIAILNEILQMNSKQALSQESLIVQLKKVFFYNEFEI